MPRRVLIVDDEPLVRTMLGRALRAYDIVAVASIAEAQALLELGDAFDVILCDLMMPERTGMDLHAFLARERPGLEARIIFLTGGAFTARAQAFVASIANPVVSKPVDFGELRQLIDRMALP